MAIGIQDQYFGTEIEMTGITRQRAAEKVAELFGTQGRWGSSRQKMRRLYMSCGSGGAVLHSLRCRGAAARLHSWHLN